MTTTSTVSDAIIDLMARKMEDEEASLEDAVTLAVEFVRTQGLSDQFLAEHGEAMIRDLWRQHQHAFRQQALRTVGRALDTNPLADDAAVYEALYQTENGWRRLGDFTLFDCEYVEFGYRERAAANSRMADFFETLRKRMEGGQRVRDVYTPDELRAMFEKA